MIKKINLIFPNQIFKQLPDSFKDNTCYLIEEYLFFRQYNFHIKKLAFQRNILKEYKNYLTNKGYKVTYIETNDPRSDIRKLIKFLSENYVNEINFIDPVDFLLKKRITKEASINNIKLNQSESPLFLNTNEKNDLYFSEKRKRYLHSDFYKKQRLSLNILVENKKPIGEKWSFDDKNRKKYPKEKNPPIIDRPKSTKNYEKYYHQIKELFPNALGEHNDQKIFPTNFNEAELWLDNFLKNRFSNFGDYEDAILSNEVFLNHSVISPLINTGLLEPKNVVTKIIDYAEKNNISINNTEGIIRQIIGWREFIRGLYITHGVYSRTKNFWGFKRKIPPSFYNGSTGITPVDDTINKINSHAYCHHIERLMIIGNFMLLCEFDPDEVYQWFMELFIDAYDWVMVPNIYGMSQFADGGLFSTKPYISSSNYIIKMSNYKKDQWCEIWDALFWRFMNKQRNILKSNPRLNMLINNFDRMDKMKQNNINRISSSFLSSLK